MHEVWRVLVIRQNRVEQMSSLWHEVYIRWSRVVTGKHGMAALMISLKEAKIKAEAIPVNMYQGKTSTKKLKYKD